jgi:hypothetical protein
MPSTTLRRKVASNCEGTFPPRNVPARWAGKSEISANVAQNSPHKTPPRKLAVGGQAVGGQAVGGQGAANWAGNCAEKVASNCEGTFPPRNVPARWAGKSEISANVAQNSPHKTPPRKLAVGGQAVGGQAVGGQAVGGQGAANWAGNCAEKVASNCGQAVGGQSVGRQGAANWAGD